MKKIFSEMLWEWMVDYRQEMDEIDSAEDIEKVLLDTFVYSWGTEIRRYLNIGKRKIPGFEDTCAFCGHIREEHKQDKCWGTPKDAHLNADGECPCLGFEKRNLEREN